MTRYDIKRNRRIHPSTYGGVGGRGREAPRTRSNVGLLRRIRLIKESKYLEELQAETQCPETGKGSDVE